MFESNKAYSLFRLKELPWPYFKIDLEHADA